MNYLAHLLLVGEDINLLIGNFIADHVKGSRIESFNDEIQLGIKMHRAIDSFTDAHPLVAGSIQRLRPDFRKYAGVIVDMFYDHFLAANWQNYSDDQLPEFTSRTYRLLLSKQSVLPARSQKVLTYMSNHDWLQSYAELKGLHQAFKGMAYRTTFDSGMENAVFALEKNYELYKNEFTQFFPQLSAYVSKEFPAAVRNKS